MSMTMVVTRDVPDRFRGFLASVLLEIAPGTYVGPRINPAVRERVWSVLSEWHGNYPRCGVVMVWDDPHAIAGLGVVTLGVPPTWLVDSDGLILGHHPLTATELERLSRKAP